MSENESELKPELHQYEIGFLIAPILPEDKIPEEFHNLTALVEKAGGVVNSSEMPKMINLAYPVSQTREHKKTSYNQAYFGWLRFDCPSNSTQALHDELKRHSEVTRFLIISLPKITVSAPRRRPIVPRRPPVVSPEVPAAAPMTQDQIDKEIEQLLSETKV